MSFPISQAFCNLIPAPSGEPLTTGWQGACSDAVGCGWILGGGRAHQWQWRAPGAAAEGAFCAGSPATCEEWVHLLPLLESDELVILCVPETSPGRPATENDFLVVFIPTDLHPPHKAHREGARFSRALLEQALWREAGILALVGEGGGVYKLHSLSSLSGPRRQERPEREFRSSGVPMPMELDEPFRPWRLIRQPGLCNQLCW